MERMIQKEVEKKRIDARTAILIRNRIKHVDDDFKVFAKCPLVIEAVIEDLAVKQQLFSELEATVSADTLLASNTSSLSITAIAAGCKHPGRVVGMHFFNPVPLMALVEIIPGMCTDASATEAAREYITQWGKKPVLAKDTPGFIVNRVARPFYGEALRILEEGIADIPSIDWAMRELGGFRMGPFELMDLIGNDINYKVTETIFEAFYYDPRYRPSITQKRMVEANLLGRKTDKGYYTYGESPTVSEPTKDKALGTQIVDRIVAMLINEAVEARLLNIASAEDLDKAVTAGLNYPRGLLAWADERGSKAVLKTLDELQSTYGDDRYRASALLRRVAASGATFTAA
jgi:3-hydroxybutyryl-CoA dehydrogenase